MTKKRQSCRSFAYLVIKDNGMPSWRESEAELTVITQFETSVSD